MGRLNKEERDILRSYEKGEWRPVRKKRAKLREYRSYAKATLKKNKRINIRISAKDLEEIQKKAIEEGLPYQTLISSILHKYVSGRLPGTSHYA